MEMRFLNLILEGPFSSWRVDAKREAQELSMTMFFFYTMCRNPVNSEKECSKPMERSRDEREGTICWWYLLDAQLQALPNPWLYPCPQLDDNALVSSLQFFGSLP